METHPGTPPTQAAPPGVSFDGQTEAPAPPAQTGRRRFSRRLVIPLAVLGAVLLLGIAYRYWYTTTHFVWTDNAQVAGPIIQVGSLNAGQVTAVLTDVGQHVEAGQVVARVAVPEVVGAAPSGTAKLGFTDTQSQLVDVTAPVSGVVVARMADPGSTVAAGQPILAVVDPTRLYVTANVNEADIHRIRVGDPVDVTVDSLGMTLPGRVEAIARASAGSFSLIPQQNSTANFTKVAQVVPVKISVDYGNLPLVVGTSVEVNIHVQ
jgi:multidrug resistance efflux pump